MMVKVLLYAYCTGRPSSRKIERATYRDVALRVLAADPHPDHDSIAEFRRRHLQALAGLFVQVLRLCQAAGLVKLGHVALDGTKIKAHASKHKAMSYDRMGATEQELEREVQTRLQQAEQVDTAEDATLGRGQRGDEMPAELARRERRLATIRRAKAELEAQAREQAQRDADEARAKLAARAQRVGSAKGGVPTIPDPEQARPAPKAQLNFTDPESRIMLDGATKGFVQAYNAEAAVDAAAQVIVACGVTQAATDVQQFLPVLAQIQAHVGQLPASVSADAGFFSEANLTAPLVAAVDCYVPPDRCKHGQPGPRRPYPTPVAEQMRAKLRTPEGRAIYARRKTLPEPVFGQIKEGRGFRRFSLRGLTKVGAEWAMICLTHNLLTLFGARQAVAMA
jgi:hypothetical protein